MTTAYFGAFGVQKVVGEFFPHFSGILWTEMYLRKKFAQKTKSHAVKG